MKKSQPGITLFLLVALFVLTSLACNAVTNAVNPAAPLSEESVIQAAVATIEARSSGGETVRTVTQSNVLLDSNLQDTLTSLYDRVNPSVVLVLTYVDSFVLGTGSGFVFDEAGHIVTNNHVILEGDEYEVVYADGDRRHATVAGSDIDSDLAVLSVEDAPGSAPPIVRGNADLIDVGQIVVALGSPFGQQGSMSMGIISGLGRSLESQRPSNYGGTYSLPQVIQTDAPINPGNSGGPLLNLDGEVLGVSSAIRTTTGLNSGVGFAIPVSAVNRIIPALITEGSYHYPYMGLSSGGGQITLEQQEAWGLPQAVGVYVGGVTSGGPAEEAGLIPAGINNLGGDLIIAVDGQSVADFNDLISHLVFKTEVGQTITLTVIRDGETIDLPLILGERPQ